jgi:DNA-binding beta-propeller fold protein YncE
MGIDGSKGGAILFALAAAALASAGAPAQIAVSANDNKAVMNDGVVSIPANVAADTVTLINLGVSPPKVIAEIAAPSSVVGPPSSVAVASDESIAIVTAAIKIDPADAKKTVPDNRVSVIDLKASPPAVVQTVIAGMGAAGVAINRAGTLVLVANRAEGSVSVFSVAAKRLTPVGKIQLGAANSGPSAVSFTPDGKSALVTRDGDHKISVLSIDGSKVEHAKRDMNAGLRPYPLGITSDGRYAAIGNIGLGDGDADTMSLIDLQLKPPRVVETVTVGQTPEGLAVAPDGIHVAVTVMNGSNKPKASPYHAEKGLLRVFRIVQGRFQHVADASVGRWCQGAAWSANGQTLLVQCMVEREILAFAFNGKELKAAASIKVNGGPAGIHVANQ